METVLLAINLGDDTDTIGALAGGLSGSYYGLKSIPVNWLDCMARNREIVSMIGDFANKLYSAC